MTAADFETIRKVFRFEADRFIVGEAAVQRLEERVDELQAGLNDALDIIIWMSGSDDFSPNGKAAEGWAKSRERLDQLFEIASRKEEKR